MLYNFDPFLIFPYRALTINEEPPTLYSIMNSMANFENEDQIKIKDLALATRERIFNFEYPISVNLGKEKFEELFLKHYMFRRINYDTFTSFRLHLEVKLNEIMPKYNKMIDGFMLLNFDGEVTKHIRSQNDERNIKNTGESSGITNTESSGVVDSRSSDTPQNLLEDVKDGSYVTEFNYSNTDDNSNVTSSTESSSDTKDVGKLLEEITISKGDSIDEYKKYLEIVENIYSMIFKECDCLFYGIV